MVKEYTKLNKVENYDKDAVEELAEALNEIHQLKTRVNMLENLVNENDELHLFVWRTAEGEFIPVHKLENSHLTNIMQHLIDTRRPINKALRGEANKRKMPIPMLPNFNRTGIVELPPAGPFDDLEDF